MASNTRTGLGRKGSIKKRTQLQNPNTKLWQKRGPAGKFVDVKTTGGKFKGVRREK